MVANYDASQVGVPYIRIPEVGIVYTVEGKAIVTAFQDLAVKLLDNSLVVIKQLPPLSFTIDLATQGSDTVPLVSPATGEALGPTVSNNMIMLSILAALRVAQLAQNSAL